MIYSTNIQENKGSFRTTVPSAISRFLGLNTDKKAKWILEVDEEGNPIITVEFEDKNAKKDNTAE